MNQTITGILLMSLGIGFALWICGVDPEYAFAYPMAFGCLGAVSSEFTGPSGPRWISIPLFFAGFGFLFFGLDFDFQKATAWVMVWVALTSGAALIYSAQFSSEKEDHDKVEHKVP